MSTRRNVPPITGPLRLSIAAYAILCPLSLLLAWGCHAAPGVHEPAPEKRAALHPICCGSMHDVMAEIDKTYRRAHRLPVRQMRDRNFVTMEECAQQLAAHATTLTASANLTGADPADAAVFDRLAHRLGTSAAALSSAAGKKNQAEVRKWFATLTSTCNSCHASFRDTHTTEQNGGA